MSRNAGDAAQRRRAKRTTSGTSARGSGAASARNATPSVAAARTSARSLAVFRRPRGARGSRRWRARRAGCCRQRSRRGPRRAPQRGRRPCRRGRASGRGGRPRGRAPGACRAREEREDAPHEADDGVRLVGRRGRRDGADDAEDVRPAVERAGEAVVEREGCEERGLGDGGPRAGCGDAGEGKEAVDGVERDEPRAAREERCDAGEAARRAHVLVERGGVAQAVEDKVERAATVSGVSAASRTLSIAATPQRQCPSTNGAGANGTIPPATRGRRGGRRTSRGRDQGA